MRSLVIAAAANCSLCRRSPPTAVYVAQGRQTHFPKTLLSSIPKLLRSLQFLCTASTLPDFQGTWSSEMIRHFPGNVLFPVPVPVRSSIVIPWETRLPLTSSQVLSRLLHEASSCLLLVHVSLLETQNVALKSSRVKFRSWL